MLNNKKFNFVLAFLLAVGLWMYVIGQQNPVIKKSFRGIPVTFTNAQTLNDNGLALRSASDDSMRVTITGKRDKVSAVSKSDIVASVDLSTAQEGQNRLQVSLKVPESVDVDNQSLDEVLVECEPIVTESRKVKVEYSGQTDEDEEIVTLNLEPEEITVTGAKSLVSKVACVRAVIDAADVTKEPTSMTCTIAAVDQKDKTVKNVTTDEDSCIVAAVRYKVKEVPFRVKTAKAGSSGKKVTGAPGKIYVAGPESVLDKIKKIETKTLDLSGITKTGEVRVVPALPKGAVLSGRNRVITVTVKVG